MNNITTAEIADIIEKKDNIAVICHIRPDGDTVGSAFGLKFGYPEKNIAVVCGHTVPKRLMFIADGQEIYLPNELPFEPDFVISVDTANFELIGDGTLAALGKERADIKIDHHLSGEEMASLCYTDHTSAACAEIIYEILAEKNRVTKSAASALYAAIASDTGCFKYSNTTPKTHIIAARTIEAGADFCEINTRLFQTKTANEAAAIRYAYNNISLHQNGTVAFLLYTNEVKAQLGITSDEISVANDIAREIEGVDLGINVTQNDENPEIFKISFRSNRYTDVNALAKRLGGGGHLRASGARIKASSPDEAKEIILAAVKEAAEK